MHDYSIQTLNKRRDEAARKDVLLEYISAKMKQHGIRTDVLREFDPAITRNAAMKLRDQDRSACSIERLEAIAAWIAHRFESVAA